MPRGASDIRTGAASELYVAAEFLRAGAEQVFTSVAPSGPVDLIYTGAGQLKRVQVKTGWLNRKGRIRFSLRRKDMKYDDRSFDELALVWNEFIWIVPWAYVSDRHTITINLEAEGEWGRRRLSGVSE